MKKINQVWMLLVVVIVSVVSLHMPVQAAGKMKLNQTEITLCRYYSAQLKVSGTKKAVKWKSSNPNVVSVNKKGKITAQDTGDAIVIATVDGKRLFCEVKCVEYTAQQHMAAYAYAGANSIFGDYGVKVKNMWIGASVDNYDIGVAECQYTDLSGTEKTVYVYASAQSAPSSSHFNGKSQYYGDILVKVEGLEPSPILKTRLNKISVKSVSKVLNTQKSSEKFVVKPGENVSTLNSWLNIKF